MGSYNRISKCDVMQLQNSLKRDTCWFWRNVPNHYHAHRFFFPRSQRHRYLYVRCFPGAIVACNSWSWALIILQGRSWCVSHCFTHNMHLMQYDGYCHKPQEYSEVIQELSVQLFHPLSSVLKSLLQCGCSHLICWWRLHLSRAGTNIIDCFTYCRVHTA